MAKRGPKPKPSLVKRVEGTDRNKQVNLAEPVITAALEMPVEVAADDIASREWDRVVRAMPPGIYTALDAGVLAVYAQSWSHLHSATRDIALDGTIVATKEGLGVHPAFKIWAKSAEMLLKTGDRLGLSPGVRSRLELPKTGEKPQSRFGGLLKQS